MTVAAQDLVFDALRLLGTYGAAEDPPAEDSDLALRALNEMLDQSNANHLSVYSINQRILGLTAGTATYTMGPGGDLDYPRPAKVESAGIIMSNGLRQDLEIITSAQWALIPEKTAQARLPLRLWNSNAMPLTTLNVWPTPIADTLLEVWVWNALASDVVLTDSVDLPFAYGRALKYNLAVAIAPYFGVTLEPSVTAIANESRAQLQALNASMFANTQDPPAPPAAAG